VLSDVEIKRRVEERSLVIEPFEPWCLNPAGYDARSIIDLEVKPLSYELIATLERFELPLDIVGFIYLRSSLAREGLIGSFAVIDPGFKGNLTLAVFNASKSTIQVKQGERIVQVVFHELTGRASKGYAGKYQDSVGIVPSKRVKSEGA